MLLAFSPFLFSFSLHLWFWYVCSMVVNFRYTKDQSPMPTIVIMSNIVYRDMIMFFVQCNVQWPIPLCLQHEFDIRITGSPTKQITIHFSSKCKACLCSVLSLRLDLYCWHPFFTGVSMNLTITKQVFRLNCIPIPNENSDLNKWIKCWCKLFVTIIRSSFALYCAKFYHLQCFIVPNCRI